jgi:KaiC/GvpD/RAD55 family RecA-like ATPase
VADLGAEHRNTLEHIFDRPSSANIEWRRVLSLLEAVGTVREEHNGKFEVTIGDETEVFQRPHGKDVDEEMLEDLRRMLVAAGIAS